MKILSLLLVITLSFVAVNGYGTLVGGITEIKDVKSNKEVQDLGKFAVEEYNKNHQGGLRGGGGGTAGLVFTQVVEAKQQVVTGIKYYLKIEATQNGLTKTFESEVVVAPWKHPSKQLISFSPSSQ
ncbi:Proteinase inhibitor I25, cystatin [Corchorus olitorius]|uniref:Proteinase inhibitor I25, cystatin n=1 Tax=Corchorus olitorius TaxID=93759 RepID=A0A1R3GBL1_9ROSI|nr:Proteinase inhibitor I25, cystatin [Corchorus olitorius]